MLAMPMLWDIDCAMNRKMWHMNWLETRVGKLESLRPFRIYQFVMFGNWIKLAFLLSKWCAQTLKQDKSSDRFGLNFYLYANFTKLLR